MSMKHLISAWLIVVRSIASMVVQRSSFDFSPRHKSYGGCLVGRTWSDENIPFVSEALAIIRILKGALYLASRDTPTKTTNAYSVRILRGEPKRRDRKVASAEVIRP